MSARNSALRIAALLPLLAVATAAPPALAADPVFDPMRPDSGPTATAPRPAEREMKRDLDRKTPTLTERFGLPPVSGPLPVPSRLPPALANPDPGALPPPPLPRPARARQTHDRDG